MERMSRCCQKVCVEPLAPRAIPPRNSLQFLTCRSLRALACLPAVFSSCFTWSFLFDLPQGEPGFCSTPIPRSPGGDTASVVSHFQESRVTTIMPFDQELWVGLGNGQVLIFDVIDGSHDDQEAAEVGQNEVSAGIDGESQPEGSRRVVSPEDTTSPSTGLTGKAGMNRRPPERLASINDANQDYKFRLEIRVLYRISEEAIRCLLLLRLVALSSLSSCSCLCACSPVCVDSSSKSSAKFRRTPKLRRQNSSRLISCPFVRANGCIFSNQGLALETPAATTDDVPSPLDVAVYNSLPPPPPPPLYFCFVFCSCVCLCFYFLSAEKPIPWC